MNRKCLVSLILHNIFIGKGLLFIERYSDPLSNLNGLKNLSSLLQRYLCFDLVLFDPESFYFLLRYEYSVCHTEVHALPCKRKRHTCQKFCFHRLPQVFLTEIK